MTANTELDPVIAERVARRHLGLRLRDHEEVPGARRLDPDWLAQQGYLWMDVLSDRVVLYLDLGGGHMMEAVVLLPADFDLADGGMIEIDGGTLLVGVEDRPDLRWDLSQVLWRPR
jgi:hypothetical protein